MAKEAQHRSRTPGVPDAEYLKIIKAFNIKTGTPFPGARHNKPRVFKRTFRHVRK